MEDTDFDFDVNIKKKRGKEWDHKRIKGRESRYKEFSAENYDLYDEERGGLTGTTLIGAPDGMYVKDIDCDKIIPMEDWDEHILNEHVVPYGDYIRTTNTPSHEI